MVGIDFIPITQNRIIVMQPNSFYFLAWFPNPSTQVIYHNYLPQPLSHNMPTFNPSSPSNSFIYSFPNFIQQPNLFSPIQSIGSAQKDPRIHNRATTDNIIGNIAESQNQNKNIVVDQNVYKYAKKNAESNLINQIFSYLSTPLKSGEITLRLVDGDIQKKQVFYEVMSLVKRQNRKYINRIYIKELLLAEKSHPIHGILQKIKIESTLQIVQFKLILRKLTLYFLNQKCILSVLTSNKLDRFSIREHLSRRRAIYDYLKYHLAHSRQEIQVKVK